MTIENLKKNIEQWTKTANDDKTEDGFGKLKFPKNIRDKARLNAKIATERLNQKLGKVKAKVDYTQALQNKIKELEKQNKLLKENVKKPA